MTELEVIMMNWYGRALKLPEHYLTDIAESKAGACLQNSASDCIFSCLMAARARAIKQLKGDNTEVHDSVYLPNLVAYASKEAHSSTEKACLMAFCKLHVVETDEEGVLRGDALQAAIEEDVEAGMTPFFAVATIGTTAGCIFDNLAEIGPVCEKYPSLWFHVDGAYAGNSLILPEMRHIAKGLEYSDSFNTNANKFMLTNFDCSLMWVRNAYELTSALAIDPLYLQHEHSGGVIDFRHYGIPLSRRFRALKLWFVFRTYGITGLQKFQRNHIALAKRFEEHVLSDDRFEVVNKVELGLVCFRLR
jgi:tyrosine decarboxylase